MNPNKKNIFKTYLPPLKGGLGPGDNPLDYPLSRLFISSLFTSFPTGPSVCNFTTDSTIFIYLATSPVEPSLEDICFASNNLNNPFQGNDRYYKISLITSPGAYYARINNDGIIVEIGECPGIT